MAIELQDASVSKVAYIGQDDFNIGAGKTLCIETSPNGDEILNVIVSEGKSWRVQINIEITETNA